MVLPTTLVEGSLVHLPQLERRQDRFCDLCGRLRLLEALRSLVWEWRR